MKRNATGWILALGLASACTGEPPAPPVALGEVNSPAGPGSGEPFVSTADGAVYMSWIEAARGGHELRFSRWEGGGWTDPRAIVWSDGFFVNWADFPSVTATSDGALWAHWLQRGEAGGYDYGIRITHSIDGGETWAEAWTPHQDGTPTEHGFVSTVPMGDDVGFVWLDGRSFVDASDGRAATEETALYFRTTRLDGTHGPETLVDGRVCDCCQTDAAVTSSGPVVAFRDRSPEEIRDIRVARWLDGAWTPGVLVHEDGWETAACPVNGPAVAAQGELVAVAWFSAAGDVPRVKVAFSDDAAESFGPPITVDLGNPAGRVDLLMVEDGSVLVSWLERMGGDWADVVVRAIDFGGGMSDAVSVSASSSERASGFPRMARAGDGSVLIAWTDVAGLQPQIRVGRLAFAAEAR